MTHPLVQAWSDRGAELEIAGQMVFVVDVPPAVEEAEPLVILHGFPTSSFDWHHVIDRFAARRRVIACDLVGFGLSSKPDRRYSIEFHADIVEVLLTDLGLHRIALVTHDLGDSVGGELLAREQDGTSALKTVRRVITNGSIYMDLVELTAGQQFLLSLADERGWPDLGDPAVALRASLAATCAPGHQPDDDELDAQWELIARQDGHELLPRLIRYIEDRRARGDRYTGAIEGHPSDLTIVWGDADPIALVSMAHRLAGTRPDATLTLLEGVGHYPMIEVPDRFAEAVLAGL